MKTIGFSQDQYDEITRIGKECGFNMDAGRNGQRAKFVVAAVKIAQFEMNALKDGEEGRNGLDPSVPK